jgi:outer membrane usher protein FimD/PapC
VEGELHLPGKDGGKVKLEEALPVELTVNGEKREGFTGRDGYFYLENIPIGEHELRVRRADGDCMAKFTVPDSAKIVVNLGALACIKETPSASPLK